MKKRLFARPFYLISAVLILFVIILGISSSQDVRAAAIIHVKSGGLVSGTCSTWETACDLQYGLGYAVSGDEVWVQQGVYKPTSGIERTAAFHLKSGVGIYGGFQGTENNRVARNWEAHPTILSGDIGVAGNNGDNSFNVVIGSGTDAAAVLDGFTITAGNASAGGPTEGNGGGMYVNAGNPTLTNLIFEGNSSLYRGGGMYCVGSASHLTNVTFMNNNGGNYGGGLLSKSSNLILEDVYFIKNTTIFFGGGMFVNLSNLTMDHVIFDHNTSYRGAGMYIATDFIETPEGALTKNDSEINLQSAAPDLASYVISLSDVTFTTNTGAIYGGGLYNDNISPVLNNVNFISNSAQNEGGGMYNRSSNPHLTNVTFANNSTNNDGGGMSNNNSIPTLTNVTFRENVAAYHGGGMYNLMSDPTLSGVTFVGNTSGYYGGGLFGKNSLLNLTNVSFIENSAGWYGGGMFNNLSTLNLTSAIFDRNTAYRGAGLYLASNFIEPAANPALDINSSIDLQVAVPSAEEKVVTIANVTFTGNSGAYLGGGLYNDVISPTLKYVDFVGNSAINEGGGLYNINSNPKLTQVTFTTNSTDHDGGGMSNENSDPALVNVKFSDNTAGLRGGGVYNNGSSPSLVYVSFENNSAGDHGGGLENSNSSDPKLINVIFKGNSAADSGGGLANYQSNPSLANVIFFDNSSDVWGGGMANDTSNPTLDNVTFDANTAIYKGGAIYNTASTTTIHNSILWANLPEQIFNESSSNTITYSDLQGGCPSGDTCSHIISTNPLFVNPATGNLRLSETSPAIDAGDNTVVPADTLDLNGNANTTEPLPYDIEGHPRFMDIPGVVDSGNGVAPIVDMGAFERSVLTLTDLNLLQATNSSGPWVAVTGSYSTGFTMLLNPAIEYYYLNTDTINVNPSLKDGLYPFYIDSYPTGFFEYWASQGVVSGAPGALGVMWEIINGNQPFFYLKVTNTDEYMLVDGLQYLSDPSVEDFLRINGDNQLGAYSFGGVVQDADDNPEQVTVKITFYGVPEVNDQDVSTLKNTPVDITLTAKNLYPPILNWTIVSPPTKGNLSGTAPNLTYTPNLNNTNPDSFTFRGNDGYADSTLGTVSITIVPPVFATTTSVNCGSGSPIVTYKSPITCVATVMRTSGYYFTPSGTVSWTTNGSGTFDTSPCTLSGSAGTATCSVTYTPTAVGTGSHQITATYSGIPEFVGSGSSGNQTVTVNKANATCDIDGYTGVYDTAFHGASGSCTGIDGENPGTLNLGSTYKNVPGGIAHWTFTGNANYYNQSSDVDITISKANATCVVNGYTGVYDATFHGASGSCSGIGGENPGTLNLGSTFKNVPGGVAHWVFTGNGNYNNQSGDVSIVITKIPITVTADAKTKKVGQPDPPLTYSYTQGVLLPGDTFTGSLTRQSGEIVGVYPILIGTLSLSGNYDITYVGANLTITINSVYLPLIIR